MGDKLKQQLIADGPSWEQLNRINLTEFATKTNPWFFIWKCELNDMDCKYVWKPRLTYLGRCMELDPNSVPGDNTIKLTKLSLMSILSEILIINF